MQTLFRLARKNRSQDILGVLRGLAKVGGQVVKRLDSLPEDTIYLTRNVDAQLADLGKKVNEFKDFMQTADDMMNAGEGEEFVTFEKPVFEYKNKSRSKDHLMKEYIQNTDVEPKKEPLTPVEIVKRERLLNALKNDRDDSVYLHQSKQNEDRVYGKHDHLKKVQNMPGDVVSDVFPIQEDVVKYKVDHVIIDSTENLNSVASARDANIGEREKLLLQGDSGISGRVTNCPNLDHSSR